MTENNNERNEGNEENEREYIIIAGTVVAVIAVAATPLTLSLASAGAILCPKYTLFNCILAGIVGFVTGYTISNGTFSIDQEHYDRQFQSNMDGHTQRLREARRMWEITDIRQRNFREFS